MQENMRIENLQVSNIDDLIYVCSSKKLSDPVHQQGIKLKNNGYAKRSESMGHALK